MNRITAALALLAVAAAGLTGCTDREYALEQPMEQEQKEIQEYREVCLEGGNEFFAWTMPGDNRVQFVCADSETVEEHKAEIVRLQYKEISDESR